MSVCDVMQVRVVECSMIWMTIPMMPKLQRLLLLLTLLLLHLIAIITARPCIQNKSLWTIHFCVTSLNPTRIDVTLFA